MANRLFIYVPFNKATNSDIKTGALELEKALNKAGVSITTTSGHSITRAKLMFLGEEAQASDIDDGDVLFVHGHGGPDDATVSDNSGGEIILRALTSKLNKMDGAGAYYFAICFSAKDQHIAKIWKNNHDTVYGYEKVLEGGLITVTRSGTIRACMLCDNRLIEIA
jgi:hypothetical protein